MPTITGKDLEDWKVAFAQSGIKYDSDEEYQEAIYNLVGYFDALVHMDQQYKAAEIQIKG